MPGKPLKQVLLIGLLSLALTAGHVYMIFVLGEGPQALMGYANLGRWDARILQSIAEHGYVNELPFTDSNRTWDTNNVAYPPAFPYFSRFVGWLAGVDSAHAVLLGSQFFTWLFWMYLLLMLRAFHIPWYTSAPLVLAILAYPASMFMVSGYTDSMMTALGFGIIYWLHSPAKSKVLLAALHCFALCAAHTRGILWLAYPCAYCFPAAVHWCRERNWQRLIGEVIAPLGAMTLAGLAGASLLPLISYVKFGAWDIYFQTVDAVWGIGPINIWEPFNFSIYSFSKPAMVHNQFSADFPQVGRFINSVLMALLVPFCALELILMPFVTLRRRFGSSLVLTAFAIQYALISVHGPHYNLFILYPLCSMRYAIGLHALVLFYIAWNFGNWRRSGGLRRRLSYCGAAALAEYSIFLAIQYRHFAYEYLLNHIQG